MNEFLYYICLPLGYLMKGCYWLISNYGVAIILFTLVTKIVLLPLSIWIQKNSIRMVKIQPEVNFIKARLQGNLDEMAEEQAKLFKKEKYHPLLAIIPLILQVILLLGVVYIIYRPLEYIFAMSSENIEALASFLKLNVEDSSFELAIIDAIKNGTITSSTIIPSISQETLSTIISQVSSFNTNFLGMNLSIVPANVWGLYTLLPVVAGVSSWFMCFTQNLSNVIQKEQGKFNKYGIMGLSIVLSLYLGLFVPAGIAIYWIASNVMSVIQMYALNAAINPKKYVDYEALEQSRKALFDAKAYGSLDKKSPIYKQMKKREKEDYKKFKNVVNKHIVIYSEKSGFYKYYKNIIDEILKCSNLKIHYVTNDYNDAIFKLAEKEKRIIPYYISLKKTVMLMMMVETDIFIMTTPDLNKYYLKRSFVKPDTEYIFVPHDPMSVHMGFNEGALDYYDTIFCSGPHVYNEVKKTEEVYNLKPKKLVEFGYPFLDDLVNSVKCELKNKKQNEKNEILIAPSWQEDNILDSCIDEIIEQLYCDENHITIRPHPEYVKRFEYKLKDLIEKHKDKDKLTFELDFSNNKSIYTSDLLITDWSGIAVEFCFATNRPAVFINTKMKVCNKNWQKIGITPAEIELRNKIGVALEKDELNTLKETTLNLFKNKEDYGKKIADYYNSLIYNHGVSGRAGAKYIIKSLIEKEQKKKEDK